MLWLALYFPRFALEVFPSEQSDWPAVAVWRERVCALNLAAEQAGIALGQRLSSALGLAPGLRVCTRETAREAAALYGLACWAGRFTPQLCMHADDCLLLEVAGCERLFGGYEKLRQAALPALFEQGWSVRSALAPTPLAAYWLALAGDEQSVLDLPQLPAALAPLPCKVLGLDEARSKLLRAIGAQRLQDVFALPRAGLSQRLGAEFSLLLARALGEVPDLRASFVFPEHFLQRIELGAAISQTQALLFVARRLVSALSGWLAVRMRGIRECVLLLEHADRTQTRLPLRFTEATRDIARIERVLRESLECLVLRASVEYLALQAEEAELLTPSSAALFGEAPGSALPPLIDRLRARLGEEAVCGLQALPAHRPEMASASTGRPAPSQVPAMTQRPRWLLARPLALPEIGGAPQRDGPLQLLAGPERIESGWWDAGEAGALGELRRDYFVALTRRGECLWVFRDAEGWFLHGFFA
jgi:protein ImuB